MKKKISPERMQMFFLLLYFPILTVERIISLARMVAGDYSTYNGLDYYMALITVASLITTYVFIAVRGKLALFRNSKGKFSMPASTEKNYRTLAVAVGILLLGGMVHTPGSIPPMQFVSYGCILVSMAFRTAISVKKDGYADRKWLSFAYVLAYSMAIPVVYHTGIDLAFLFIPIEIVVSLGMVILFTSMLVKFYSGDGESDFSLIPFLVGLFGDALVLAMRWHEEINYFVLIFICAVTILWFTGTILGVNKQSKK